MVQERIHNDFVVHIMKVDDRKRMYLQFVVAIRRQRRRRQR